MNRRTALTFAGAVALGLSACSAPSATVVPSPTPSALAAARKSPESATPLSQETKPAESYGSYQECVDEQSDLYGPAYDTAACDDIKKVEDAADNVLGKLADYDARCLIALEKMIPNIAADGTDAGLDDPRALQCAKGSTRKSTVVRELLPFEEWAASPEYGQGFEQWVTGSSVVRIGALRIEATLTPAEVNDGTADGICLMGFAYALKEASAGGAGYYSVTLVDRDGNVVKECSRDEMVDEG